MFIWNDFLTFSSFRKHLVYVNPILVLLNTNIKKIYTKSVLLFLNAFRIVYRPYLHHFGVNIHDSSVNWTPVWCSHSCKNLHFFNTSILLCLSIFIHYPIINITTNTTTEKFGFRWKSLDTIQCISLNTESKYLRAVIVSEALICKMILCQV